MSFHHLSFDALPQSSPLDENIKKQPQLKVEDGGGSEFLKSKPSKEFINEVMAHGKENGIEVNLKEHSSWKLLQEEQIMQRRASFLGQDKKQEKKTEALGEVNVLAKGLKLDEESVETNQQSAPTIGARVSVVSYPKPVMLFKSKNKNKPPKEIDFSDDKKWEENKKWLIDNNPIANYLFNKTGDLPRHLDFDKWGPLAQAVFCVDTKNFKDLSNNNLCLLAQDPASKRFAIENNISENLMISAQNDAQATDKHMAKMTAVSDVGIKSGAILGFEALDLTKRLDSFRAKMGMQDVGLDTAGKVLGKENLKEVTKKEMSMG